MVYVQCAMYDECMYNDQCERYRVRVQCIICGLTFTTIRCAGSRKRCARRDIGGCAVLAIGPDGPSDVLAADRDRPRSA